MFSQVVKLYRYLTHTKEHFHLDKVGNMPLTNDPSDRIGQFVDKLMSIFFRFFVFFCTSFKISTRPLPNGVQIASKTHKFPSSKSPFYATNLGVSFFLGVPGVYRPHKSTYTHIGGRRQGWGCRSGRGSNLQPLAQRSKQMFFHICCTLC